VRDSTPHEIANAIYGTVNRGIRVMFACSGADRSGWLQRHGHCADDGVARRVAVVSSQDDADTADTPRMSGQRGEHTILGIRASLSVTGFVVADHLDTHGLTGHAGTPRSASFFLSGQRRGHLGRAALSVKARIR
jgi:hypothetical protein